MRLYYVDLPNPNATDEDSSWRSVAVCGTRHEAEAVLYKGWGLLPTECKPFITEGSGTPADLRIPDYCAPKDHRL